MSKKKAIIKRVYAELPKVQCKGLCHHQCTLIGYTTVERRMMTEAAKGVPPSFDTERGCCNYLTKDNRCSIYSARPWVCRSFGVIEDLPCPHGCRPFTGVLTTEQELELKQHIDYHGGNLEFNATPEDLADFLEINLNDVESAKMSQMQSQLGSDSTAP